MVSTPGWGGQDSGWESTGMGAGEKATVGGGGEMRRVRVRGGGNKIKWKREVEKKIKKRKYQIAAGGHTGHG